MRMLEKEHTKNTVVVSEENHVITAIVEYVKQHEALLVLAITTMVSCVIAAMKFSKYLFELGKTTYWKINSSAIELKDDSLYSVIITIIFAILILVVMMIPCFIHRSSYEKKKKLGLYTAFFLAFMAFWTIYLKPWELINVQDWESAVAVVAAIFFLTIIAYIFWGVPSWILAFALWSESKINSRYPKIKKWWGGLVVIGAAAFWFSLFSMGYNMAIPSEYRLTENGYAIVYETKDMYYMVAYEEQGDIYVLNKRQQKCDNKENLEYTYVPSLMVEIAD